MLESTARRTLRQQAHHLKPVVMTGQHGVTDAVIAEIDRALTDHELIKVRFRGLARDRRDAEIERAAAQVAADVVNVIGSIAVLYRKSPEPVSKRRYS